MACDHCTCPCHMQSAPAPTQEEQLEQLLLDVAHVHRAMQEASMDGDSHEALRLAFELHRLSAKLWQGMSAMPHTAGKKE